MSGAWILLATVAMAAPASDEALIGGAVELCVPFVATRDFDRAASAATAQGYAGNVLAGQGHFQRDLIACNSWSKAMISAISSSASC